MYVWLVLLTTSLLAAACSVALAPVALLNALAPRAGVTQVLDQSYADGPRHGVDVYAPNPVRSGTPVVVFFYGGGWEDGDRGMYRFVGATLAARGIVAVIPDYRVYPAARFPDFIEDGAAAVAWARLHAAAYGGDPARLFLMGHSAGAQIATLLSLDRTWLAAVGMDPGRDIAGTIGLAGPYDFLPLESPTLQAIFGPQSEWPRSQPINFVTPGAPSMFLAAPARDSSVAPGNTVRLAARLRASGTTVVERIYALVGHRTLLGAFAAPLTLLSSVRADVLRFVAHRSAEVGGVAMGGG
jgi:acetyl esterase/lipase